MGSELSDIDLALSLKQAGYRTVVSTKCRILGPVKSRPEQRGFSRGLFAERLFLRHASNLGLTRSLLLHPIACCLQFLAGLVRGGAFSTALGRACGASSILSALRHQRRLEAVRKRGTVTRRGDLPGNFRMDPNHLADRATPSREANTTQMRAG